MGNGFLPRLQRFAPFIMKCFPETEERGGIIESVLTDIPNMRTRINEKYDSQLQGRLLLKQDNHLAIAGSVKARGGIYEVLKHTEGIKNKYLRFVRVWYTGRKIHGGRRTWDEF